MTNYYLVYSTVIIYTLARTYSLLVRSFLLLAVRDFSFHDALKRLPMTIGSRKVRCGLRQIHFHHKGMEGFTESVLNTEVILASLR